MGTNIFHIKFTYILQLKIGEAYQNLERESKLLLNKIAFFLQYWRCCYVLSFDYIILSDLLGNRLSAMKIRKSFFSFFSPTWSSECHADKRIAQKRIDVLIVKVILIVLLLMQGNLFNFQCFYEIFSTVYYVFLLFSLLLINIDVNSTWTFP